MRPEDFDFHLPEELIATAPASPRDHSRLLVVDRKTGALEHARFYDLPRYLRAEDLLVRNNTKVFPARLLGITPDEKPFEIFLLQAKGSDLSVWNCLVKPGRKVKSGISIRLKDGTLAEVRSVAESEYEVRLPGRLDFYAWLETVGVPPLPPYIRREATLQDRADYQTVYAKNEGSIAAPTAGLHFTDRLLSELSTLGVKFADLTLHVGYGTFAPIRAETLQAHQMHHETYSIPPETREAIQTKRARLIAVGTTSLRALESTPLHGDSGQTDIFIYPGYQFTAVEGLLTNFHLPQSSLFILVSALMGKNLAQEAYAEAIRQGYRFYSYGDAMLIL